MLFCRLLFPGVPRSNNTSNFTKKSILPLGTDVYTIFHFCMLGMAIGICATRTSSR